MTKQKESPVVSFGKSDAIKKLFAAAEADNVDTDLLHEMLWLITADPRLVGFVPAVRRLKKMLETIPATWSKALETSGISSWQPVLDWVLANSGSLSAKLGSDFRREFNTTGRNPIQGSTISTFPMYGILCQPLPKEPAGEQFILLTAHLLLGYVSALRESSDLSDYQRHDATKSWKFSKDDVNPSARALRHYSMAVNQALLAHLRVTLPPKDFAEYLEDAAIPSDSKFEKYHSALVRFLEKCHGLRDWKDSSGMGGGSASGGGKWIGDRFEAPRLTIEKYRQDPDAPEEDQWGSIEVVKFQSGSIRDHKELLESGLHPEEGPTDDDDVLLSDFDCGLTKQDPGAMARAARAKARHIAKHNQVFGWTYDTLADAEIDDLLTQLTRHLDPLQTQQQWTPSDLLMVEALIFIGTTLWTGCDFERAMEIEMRQEDKSFDNRVATQWIVLPTDGGVDQMHWRIKALTPTYASSNKGDQSQLRPHEKFIDLPDLVCLCRPIARLHEQRGSRTLNRKLFQCQPERIKAAAKEWLATNFPGGRITLQKIESTLWNKLYRHTGDAALASCVISDTHQLASVRLHYTSPWVTDLQRCYKEVVNEMLGRTSASSIKPPNLTPWMSRTQNGAVGARMCPTLGAVRSMFAALYERIDETSDYCDRSEFVSYHNCLTLLTTQMFAYSTTCRAIRTPYLPLSAVCSNQAIACLSDKDDEFHHKSRQVWIPPLLQKQMEYYDQHLYKLGAEPIEGDARILQEPCFFLTKDYKLQRVRPKTLTLGLHLYLQGVAANIHRRFLRTQLLERGCTPEVVDAFMGHWQCGEEPFGPYSSFSFQEYREEIRTYLEPLLRDIGITRAIQSRIAH